MRKELETMIGLFKGAMERKGWGIRELMAAMDGRIPKSTVYEALKGNHVPGAKIVGILGEVLEIDRESTERAQALVLQLRRQRSPRGARTESFDTIENHLNAARNHCELARKELRRVDEKIAQVLDDIADRLRLTSSLNNHLKVFRR